MAETATEDRMAKAQLSDDLAGAPLLAALVESSRDLILAVGLDGRVIAMNGASALAFHALYGQQLQLGARLLDLLPEPQRRSAETHWKRALSGRSFTLDRTLRHAFGPTAGTEAAFEVTFDPIRDATGRIIGALHIARDITRRQRAETAARELATELEARVVERTGELALTTRVLSEREAEYRALFESAAVGQIQVSTDGRLVRVNPRFCDMVGHAEVDLIGLPVEEITHPDDRSLTAQVYRALAQGERDIYHGEKRYIRKDGRVIWAELFVRQIRDEEGRPLRTIAVVYDITDRRETEEALRRANVEKSAVLAQLEALLEEAPTGFAFFDRFGRYVRVNTTLAEFNGLPAIEHLGRRASEVMGANGVRVERIVAQVAASGDPVQNEEFAGFGHPGQDQQRHLLISFFPVWADDRVINVGAVLTEITEQKRHAERLRLLLAELDHRVKNTLAKVQSLITQTKGQAATAEELAAALEGRVQSMARAHGALIRGNWEGAQLRSLVADELAPYQAPGGVNAVINGPQLALRPSAALALGLALHELATNAAKYGALSVPEGRVTVRWALTPMGGIDLIWEEAGGPPVMPPARRGFGTLLVERSLEYELGGEVRLAFQPAGVVCRVTIPPDQLILETEADPAPAPVPVAAPPTRSPQAAKGGATNRILIVEDSALIALDLQLSVEGEGWTAIGPIGRLEPAMERARTGGIDGAILDINLDGVESFPIADLLRKHGVPFIFSTGYDRGTVIPDRFRDTPVLQKPFVQAALRRTLLSAFG